MVFLLLRTFLALVSLACSSALAFGQERYYDTWFFGDSLGLSFWVAPPAPLRGAMTSLEGCASICDPIGGNILFYTDGVSVWNGNHALMTTRTNLFGHLSATQSALILPDPGNPLRYYIFTLDGLTPDAGGNYTGQGRGLNYSVVDMTRANGLGGLVELNTPLLQKASEKLVGIRHSQGCGFWVVTHELESSRFFAWQFSTLGLSDPVISDIGPRYGDKDAGYLKASPDGTMLLAARSFGRTGDLFRFNAATGRVEAQLAQLNADYAASFSPNNEFLYTSYYERSALLLQYDLRNGTDVIARNVVDSMPGDAAFEGMQLGPDGRMYVVYRDPDGLSILGVVAAPDKPGAECDYRPRYEYATTQSRSYYGLPNCVDGFLGESDIPGFTEEADLIFQGDTILCPGESLPLATSPASAYRWSPSVGLSCDDCPDPDASPTRTTTYVVLASDDGGCIKRDSIVIAIADPPRIQTYGDTTICAGDSAQLGVVGGVDYQWGPAGSLSCALCPNPVAAPATTTTYTVLVTGENGCTASDQVTVTVLHPNIRITAPGAAICRGDEIRLTASGGTEYRWSPEANLDCANCDVVVATPLETTTYVVRGTKDGRCPGFDSITISVYDPPSIDAGNDTAICRGERVTLTATGVTEFQWRDAEGLSCTDCPNPTVSPERTTTYVVRGRKENTCHGVDSVTVVVYDIPTADAGTDTTICVGESVRLNAGGGVRYSWLSDGSLDCDTCARPVATPMQTTTYRVQAIDEHGCTAWDSVTVTVRRDAQIEAQGDTAFCVGGSAPLSASGAESYRWNPSKGLSCADCPNPIATPEETTVYYLIGTNASGECPAIDSVRITVYETPVVEAGGDVVACGGTNVGLHAAGAAGYRWDDSPDLSCLDCADPIAVPTITTTYYVTGISADGCEGRDSVRVIVLPGIAVAAGADTTICLGDTVRLAVTGGVRWKWEPAEGLSCTDCPDPLASPMRTTSYRATAWNVEGCEGSDSVEVIVREAPEVIRLRIRREYHEKMDTPMVISVDIVGIVGPTDVTELEMALDFDPRVMQADAESIERLLAGTALREWNVRIEEQGPGRLVVRLTAPSGRTLSGGGELLRFEGKLYLSNARGTELPFTVRSPSHCFTFETEPGYAMLDSICGLNLRLIELTAQKYIPPVVYPNPANERVTFEFGLGLDGPTRLEVFDALGNCVGLIVDGVLEQGRYGVEWDVRDVASGVYWYRLTSGDWSEGGQVRVGQ